MANNFFSKLIRNTVIISGISISTLMIKHHKDSNKVLSKVSDEFDQETQILGSWIDPLYQRVTIKEIPTWCIVGGVSVSKNNTVSQYQFIADAKDLQIVDLRKVN